VGRVWSHHFREGHTQGKAGGGPEAERGPGFIEGSCSFCGIFPTGPGKSGVGQEEIIKEK
jgi:hypothetical protein